MPWSVTAVPVVPGPSGDELTTVVFVVGATGCGLGAGTVATGALAGGAGGTMGVAATGVVVPEPLSVTGLG